MYIINKLISPLNSTALCVFGVLLIISLVYFHFKRSVYLLCLTGRVALFYVFYEWGLVSWILLLIVPVWRVSKKNRKFKRGLTDISRLLSSLRNGNKKTTISVCYESKSNNRMKVYNDLDIAVIEKYTSTLSKSDCDNLLGKVETNRRIKKGDAILKVNDFFDKLETKNLSKFCWVGQYLYSEYKVVKYRKFQRDLDKYNDSFHRDKGGVFVFNHGEMEIYPTGEYLNMIMKDKKPSWKNKYDYSGETIKLFAQLMSQCVINRSE